MKIIHEPCGFTSKLLTLSKVTMANSFLISAVNLASVHVLIFQLIINLVGFFVTELIQFFQEIFLTGLHLRWWVVLGSLH